MYYTVIQHDGHLRKQRKCRKHEQQASVFCISTFLEYRGNVVFYVLSCDKPWVFDQSECVQGPVYIIIGSNKYLLLAKFKCSAVSYRPRSFLFNLWPKCEAWVPWIEVWITRCHNYSTGWENGVNIKDVYYIWIELESTSWSQVYWQ